MGLLLIGYRQVFPGLIVPALAQVYYAVEIVPFGVAGGYGVQHRLGGLKVILVDESPRPVEFLSIRAGI